MRPLINRSMEWGMLTGAEVRVPMDEWMIEPLLLQAPAGPILQHVPGPPVPRHQQPLQPSGPSAHTQVCTRRGGLCYHHTVAVFVYVLAGTY